MLLLVLAVGNDSLQGADSLGIVLEGDMALEGMEGRFRAL
jgi:hypothetical protein